MCTWSVRLSEYTQHVWAIVFTLHSVSVFSPLRHTHTHTPLPKPNMTVVCVTFPKLRKHLWPFDAPVTPMAVPCIWSSVSGDNARGWSKKNKGLCWRKCSRRLNSKGWIKWSSRCEWIRLWFFFEKVSMHLRPLAHITLDHKCRTFWNKMEFFD
jgi:hypothetical protein